ncbi:Asp-tRNA(Asn)/Glu-tRNA(Gln) amidotransferase subunit GatB [Pseudobdellovibrio exovorus]|uniref:Aspartyl/glutamyl-tRNA(Asn/Gln) amidotransferase subunit B n=1 Tax=Pseudobdellovibrio exovorus JSS TaxID=1184267 RepID=M4V4N0_9BACT|nr:Asp-tRNA(Asn)/Glu-tRNA(Gln) amidotransferase subunit GatB [Pseudobdellovibrio exovorus]AGH94292.1 aspartyl/glutamyl-tRNA amidotransferase subunit B [Pseudobdellovibrio exovorus JSS]
MSSSPTYRGFEAVIGIEVHVQLKTQSKIFCGDATNFDAADNENTSPVSVGMPGTLPVLNKQAVEFAIKTGLALGCTIRNRSVFARKNYFYPDLPKGYQISQYDKPICENGEVTILVDKVPKTISITRAHMEEDAGKSTHFGDYTLVNYNRAGIPLLEVVSGPDMSSPQEAAEYGRTIRQIVRYLDVCDGNLEEGSLRCDCNVSVRRIGEDKLGTKVELKNLNSFRFIEKAIEYEIDRQIDEIEAGKAITQETRLYDPDKNRTYSMRTKEDAQDYRYFPDPDLLPILIDETQVEQFRRELPELPLAKAKRFQTELGLSEYDASILTAEKGLADYFEIVSAKSGNPKQSANWIMSDLIREMNTHKIEVENSPLKAEALAELIKLIDSGKISGKIAKTVFVDMWTTRKSADEIIKEKGLAQVSDTSVIEKIIDDVLAANASQVAEYRSGKTKVYGFFVGAAMKATKGQANPDVVNQILKKKLDNA